MNYALILAGGTGQRMKTSGMPKQFLDVYGKPIIIYTLEAFEHNTYIDEIVIPCNEAWIEYMKGLVQRYNLKKVKHIIRGGADRMGSVNAGLNALPQEADERDVVIIHDGVRPLIQDEIICKNVEVAIEKGNAMTVRPNTETVVVTENRFAQWADFKKRDVTYTLTSPQSFRLRELREKMKEVEHLSNESEIPLLDVSLVYARSGEHINLVIESGNNLKITTPEDYYYLKAYLELQESKHILGV